MEHQVRDNSGKEHNGDEFLDTPITQTVPRCNCYKMEAQLETRSNETKIEDLNQCRSELKDD